VQAPSRHAFPCHRDPAAPRIRVILAPPEEPEFSALVMLAGEHDHGTREAVRVSLAPLWGPTLVCLAECRFIDASVLGVIAEKARVLESSGERLALRIDPDAYTVPLIVELAAEVDPARWPIAEIRHSSRSGAGCA
jgi:hypothetical protein